MQPGRTAVVAREGKLSTTWFVHAENRNLPTNVGQARDAAYAGDPEAQFQWAEMHEIGYLVSKDNVEAFIWYFKAAYQDHAAAQRELSVMLFQGQVSKPNRAEALNWCKKAAEQNDARAQCYLGWMYFDAHGTEYNILECEKWYRKSAQQGFALAQYCLGRLYEHGRDEIPKDTPQAMHWYESAAKQGLEFVAEYLKSVEAKAERRRNQPKQSDLRDVLECHDLDEVIRIIRSGIKLDEPEQTGALIDLVHPPLIHALTVECKGEPDREANFRIAEFLLDEMEQKGVRLKSYYDPLHYAVAYRKFRVAELLLQRGHKLRFDELSNLFHGTDAASEEELFEQVDFLMKVGLNPMGAMSIADEEWQIKLLQLAIKYEVPTKPLIEGSGIAKELVRTAGVGNKLAFDNELRNFERVLALNSLRDFEAKLLKNELLKKCFEAAFRSAHLEILDLMFPFGNFDISEAVYNPVTVAVRANKPMLVKFLLNAGCTPFEKDHSQQFCTTDYKLRQDGDTPLKIAKNRGYWDIVVLLDRSIASRPFGWFRKYLG